MCCHDDTYSVYYHKNNINGKIYVGKAKSIAKRWGHNGNGYTVNRDTIFANAIKNMDGIILSMLLSRMGCPIQMLAMLSVTILIYGRRISASMATITVIT